MTQAPQSRRFIFINGRGSAGKDTQADRLVASNPHAKRISTGDIFRASYDSDHPDHELYKKYFDQIQPYIESVNKGGYLPDEVIISIVDDVINNNVAEGKDTFVFTGFPRTEPQLRAVDGYITSLRENGLKVEADYISLAVLEKHSIGRAEGRVAIARAENMPIRVDDNPEIVQNRLKTYREKTEPMLRALAQEGRLHIIKSRGSIDQVEERTRESLNSGRYRSGRERI